MPNKKLIFNSGEKHWNLTLVREQGKIGKSFAWLCVCDCGNHVVVKSSDIKSGNRKSCGCNRRKKRGPRPDVAQKNKDNRIHYNIDSKTYSTWKSMKSRCLSDTDKDYKNYGGRGIKICDRWLNSYENFLEDMGVRPKGKTIDRINVDGDYEKDNCRWATPTQQANNRRVNIYVEYDGEALSASTIARKYGIEPKTFIYRIKHGWSVDKALNTPPLIRRK